MRRLIAVLVVLVVPGLPAPAIQDATPFARQIAALSEPGGYFDTDNLLSNESSYLQVLPELSRKVTGGAYLGVGPDQNFTYIAAIRPAIAFIVDIRRDNLLLHLLFKALFHLAPTRAEYLAMLFGRPAPEGTEWRSASIDRLVGYLARTPSGDVDGLRARVDRTIETFGVPLSGDDRRTIDRFHRRFITAGVSLRFESTGRPPRSYYPTYGDLLRDTDASGRQSSMFASDAAYEFVRTMEERDLVVPVVGDFSGPTALAAIGTLLAARRETLSAFYTSNVEFYLFRDGRYPRFLANLMKIPHRENAVIIRAVFRPYAVVTRGNDFSASQLHRVDSLIDDVNHGKIRSYADLIGR